MNDSKTVTNLTHKIYFEVKPYLKAYLQGRFGKQIEVRKRTSISTALQFVPNYIRDFDLIVTNNQKILQRSDSLCLCVSVKQYNVWRENPSFVKSIEKWMYDLFCAELCAHIRAITSQEKREGKRYSVDEAIFGFYDLYDIDEDILPLKTSQKIWERYKGPQPNRRINKK